MCKPTKNQIFCPKAGQNKTVFETRQKAERFMVWNNKDFTGKHPVRAYYCEACGGYHLTSRPYLAKRGD